MSRPLLSPRAFARLPADRRPVLLVVVDTEEEFEWGKGFFRDRTSVHAMAGVPRFQEMCEEFGIRPTYVVDYPVVTQRAGYEALRGFSDAGRAVIGAHLHPWVTPPFDEGTDRRLSYPGNLDPALEARKLRTLGEAIEAVFGRRPVIYKAGRYGLGPATGATLEALGYEFDLSVCPGVDLGTDDGGPDFLDFSPDPYWFGEGRALLEIPVTAGFVGPLARFGPGLKRLGARRPFGALPALLGRTGALDRLRLSPEGMDFEQHRRLTEALLRRGTRVLTLSLHSPSLRPGYTPYVRSEADLDAFLDRCRRFFDWFLNERNGIAETPHGVRERLARPESAASAA
jgi:hypothetical protein